jgi:hypothetical protein
MSRAVIGDRSGLPPWSKAELPAPPLATGLRILGVIGPGAILLGSSIGSGEWLVGPAAFVKYGLSLLWVTTVAALLQTVLNTELIRYTLATGEPITVGFMRTRPHATFWAWFYAGLYFLQVGWPGWAGAAAGAVFFLVTGASPGPADAGSVYRIGAAMFLACVLVLLIGRRIERTLEILNWTLIVLILGTLAVLCFAYAAPDRWLATAVGFLGWDTAAGGFRLLPPGADWFLIGAFAAYSGAGGVINLNLSHWARDKGFGMGGVTGFIPAAVGGQKVHLAHGGAVFEPTPEALGRWRGWWRIAQVDQWGVFFIGALLGMALPALLYTSFLPPGRDIRGLAVAAELSQAVAVRGAALAMLVALMGAWVLFKTQLDILEGTTRAMTDILWTGSRRIRAWRGDVRLVYYGVLAVVVVWGLVALRLTQPIVLLQLGANMAGVVFVILGLHTLRVNTTLLPPELRPPLHRRVGLVLLAAFYGFFVYLWLAGGLRPDPAKGFLFRLLGLGA